MAEQRALTDQELLAILKDDRADLSLLTPEEQQRLIKLTEARATPPAAATKGMIPPSSAKGDPGYFEDKGMAGAEWHAPRTVDPDTGDTFQPKERNRPDNSLLGLPPELAVVSGIGVGRAMVGPGLSAMQRATAGVKAAASQTAPIVKYEVVKATLEQANVPPVAAAAIAAAASGLSTNGRGIPRTLPRPKPAAAARADAKASRDMITGMSEAGRATRPAVASARPAAPSASTPAARAPEADLAATRPASPTPPPDPGARPSASTPSAAPQSRPHPEGGVWSPQRVQNELGQQARRQGAKLSESEYAKATELVAQGKTPAEAVADTVKARPATGARVKLTAAESKTYNALRAKGKTHAEIMEAIEQQRELALRLGTPSSETVRQRISKRNKTGDWDDK